MASLLPLFRSRVSVSTLQRGHGWSNGNDGGANGPASDTNRVVEA